LPYVEFWQNLLYLNQTFMDQIRERQQQCNYSSYWDKYFQFPPPQEPFPVLPDPYQTDAATCDMFDTVYAAILEVNPCFNIYHITEVSSTLIHEEKRNTIANKVTRRAPTPTASSA
jgi:carboxypeptidase D